MPDGSVYYLNNSKMNTVYNWDCSTVDVIPQMGENTNVVYRVHWRLTASSDGYYESDIGVEELTTEEISSFIPFEELTQEQVIDWVEESMGEERVSDIKVKLEEMLYAQINPEYVTMTIPNIL
jgi:hypothetical protein